MRSAGLTLLKIALAVGLAIYVLSQIETRDAVLCPGSQAGDEPMVTYGSISGDWQGTDWTFTAADGGGVLRSADLGACELHPGFWTLLTGVRLPWFALSVGLWMILLVVVGWRWQILLRAAGVTAAYFTAMRLCFIGYFFNNVMPGQTGGDLVRAVLVTRGLGANRANAAMSVIVDRILGLFSLLLLATVVLASGALERGPGGPRHLDRVAQAVYLLVGGCVVGGALYLSRRIRRLLGLDALMQRFSEDSFVRKIDGALTLYRHHLGTVFLCLGISLVLQVCGVLSFWAMARAMGAALDAAHTFVIFPVVQTISAVPVAPAGWGVGETFYGKFFDWFGFSFTLGVAVSILFRLTTQMGFGLLGGLVWALSREHKQGLQHMEVES